MFPVFCQTMCLKLKCERKLIRSNKLIIILTEYSLKIFDIPKPGSIPGLGRSPGEGNGNPLQYCCLEKSHEQRSLVGYSPWGHKESGTTERLHVHVHSLKIKACM